MDLATRKAWDPFFSRGEVKVSVDDNNDIIWEEFGGEGSRAARALAARGQSPEKPRDFALIRSWRKMELRGRECHVIAMRSIVHPDVPEDPTGMRIRGEILPSGFIFEDLVDEVGSDGRSDGGNAGVFCEFTYIGQLSESAANVIGRDLTGQTKFFVSVQRGLEAALAGRESGARMENEGTTQ
jgi:hypothetical protein